MLIRKLFKFEGSHIVRDCTSTRCSRSVHGHSYKVEVLLESGSLDNGQMVVDFGLMKGTIKDWIDSFDHCHVMWEKEDIETIEFFKKMNERWIILPCSPSAEMFSVMFFFVIDKILKNTQFNNGESSDVQLNSVIVHETETGYAQCFREDMENLWKWDLSDIQTSVGVVADWRDSLMMQKLGWGEKFINPTIQLKYQ